MEVVAADKCKNSFNSLQTCIISYIKINDTHLTFSLIDYSKIIPVERKRQKQ
jgi:hypothetical protein